METKPTTTKTKFHEKITLEFIRIFSQIDVYLFGAFFFISLVFYDAMSSQIKDWKEAYKQLDTYFVEYEYPGHPWVYKHRALKKFQDYSKFALRNHLLLSLPKEIRRDAEPYMTFILECSEKYKVDPFWITAMIWTESHFKHESTSPLGASGLMQIMPYTMDYIEEKMAIGVFSNHSLTGKRTDTSMLSPNGRKLSKSYKNIEYGVSYFKHLLESFNYNFEYATVAYNMGPGLIQVRLKKNLPVGRRNDYLIKVKKAYQTLIKG